MAQAKTQKEIIDIKNLSGGLEILVQLAEKGDIDPWDIDILDVTNKYLAALDKSPRENLLNAGRAIFFASVLLRLKSDILLNISNETLLSSQQTENFFPEDDLLFNQDEVRLDLSRLESFIVRSSLGKQQRKRKISLGDLIFALQQAEEEEERRAVRAKLRSERAFTIDASEIPDNVLEIAHEEDLEDIANSFPGIEKSYAIQAGRELRVFVRPGEISDIEARRISREIALRIEKELKYPGEIKITTIRESRAIEYAR